MYTALEFKINNMYFKHLSVATNYKITFVVLLNTIIVLKYRTVLVGDH